MPQIGKLTIDERLHYVDKDYVVMDDPTNDNAPTLVMRTVGPPDDATVKTILQELNMTFADDPAIRSDGLWFCKLKANGVTYGK